MLIVLKVNGIYGILTEDGQRLLRVLESEKGPELGNFRTNLFEFRNQKVDFLVEQCLSFAVYG